MKSNQAPDVSLELSQSEADFLLSNCNSNITFGLNAMQTMDDRKTLEKLVALNEKFRSIRNKLIKAGAKE